MLYFSLGLHADWDRCSVQRLNGISPEFISATKNTWRYNHSMSTDYLTEISQEKWYMMYDYYLSYQPEKGVTDILIWSFYFFSISFLFFSFFNVEWSRVLTGHSLLQDRLCIFFFIFYNNTLLPKPITALSAADFGQILSQSFGLWSSESDSTNVLIHELLLWFG